MDPVVVVFQGILQSYLVKRCLDPVKAEPQEMLGGSNTDPHKIFMED